MDQLILSLEDTHANHSVLLGSREAQMMTVISGQKCLELYRRQDQLGFCVKMLLGISSWGSTRCFLTWRPKVTERNHLLFQLVPQTRCIEGTGYGLLPTPTASEAMNCYRQVFWRNTTPRVRSNQGVEGSARLGDIVQGRPHPECLEKMMGYPLGWTEIED